MASLHGVTAPEDVGGGGRHGTAPATTAEGGPTGLRGRPTTTWSLKKHVAHRDLAHLKWILADDVCPTCGGLQFRSYFTLRNDRAARRFDEDVEVCEACKPEAPAVPTIPTPPKALQLYGKSLAVNCELAIARRGTTGSGGNLRGTKTKRIQLPIDVEQSSTVVRTSGSAATVASAASGAAAEEAGLPAMFSCNDDGTPSTKKGPRKRRRSDAGPVPAKAPKQVVKLDAAAEYTGQPYARIPTREETGWFWQLPTTKNRFQALRLGDMIVSATSLHKAFDALVAGKHPVYVAIAKRDQRAKLLPKQGTSVVGSGFALAGTRHSNRQAAGSASTPDLLKIHKQWLKIEAVSTGGGKLLASFSALHPVPSLLSTQNCIVVPEWAAHAAKQIPVKINDDGELRAGVFLNAKTPALFALMYPILHWTGQPSWTYPSTLCDVSDETALMWHRVWMWQNREVLLLNYALAEQAIIDNWLRYAS